MVTIALGEEYLRSWQIYCYPHWKQYADKHGYDIVVITSLIDNGPLGASRPPHWQKLLILQVPEVAKYEQVVWLDTDVAMNVETSPCIVDFFIGTGRSELVGVVPESSQPRDASNAALTAAVNLRQASCGQTLNQGRSWNDVYRLNGFDTNLNDGFNAGVMVLQPGKHAHLLLEVYTKYKQSPFSWFENGPLAYHLVSRELTGALPEPFNSNMSLIFYRWYPFALTNQPFDALLISPIIRTIYENTYFMHFLGGGVVRKAMMFLPSCAT